MKRSVLTIYRDTDAIIVQIYIQKMIIMMMMTEVTIMIMMMITLTIMMIILR